MPIKFPLILVALLWCANATGQARPTTTLRSIEIKNVWVKHDTHLEPAWWEKGTEWEGVPAFTVYSRIQTSGLSKQDLNVDIEFRNANGNLLKWREKSPGFCRGNDGNLRPSWSDVVPADGYEYRAFRVPVPYSAMFLDGKSKGEYLVSVRAYCAGISSRMEQRCSFSKREGWANGEGIQLGNTNVEIGIPQLNRHHSTQTQPTDPSQLGKHPSNGLNVQQTIFCSDDLPADFHCHIQLGRFNYQGARSYVEDYVLNREHYLPLNLQKNQRAQPDLKRPAQIDIDLLIAEPALVKSEQRFQWIANTHFAGERIAKLIDPKSEATGPLILTVAASWAGKTIHRQQLVRLDLPGSENPKEARTDTLEGQIDPSAVKHLLARGYKVTGTPIEFRPATNAIAQDEIVIQIEKGAEKSLYHIELIGAVSRPAPNRWVGRCEYYREVSVDGQLVPSEKLTTTWSLRQMEDGVFLMDLPGADYRFEAKPE